MGNSGISNPIKYNKVNTLHVAFIYKKTQGKEKEEDENKNEIIHFPLKSCTPLHTQLGINSLSEYSGRFEIFLLSKYYIASKGFSDIFPIPVALKNKFEGRNRRILSGSRAG